MKEKNVGEEERGEGEEGRERERGTGGKKNFPALPFNSPPLGGPPISLPSPNILIANGKEKMKKNPTLSPSSTSSSFYYLPPFLFPSEISGNVGKGEMQEERFFFID